MQDIFADIRPYDDAEVSAVLVRLLKSKELQQALLSYFYPQFPKWLSVLAPLAFWPIRKSVKGITTVSEFQRWLAESLESLLKRTTQSIEVRGLERLDPKQSYLWISNHRDIAMDPLLINYSLFKAGWPTSRIAIGDNLLNHKDVADIMRLNKSFIVKRDISNKRQKLAELKRLSAYIHHSLEQHCSVWIAQREGRAKNGIDKTDTAVLKMLTLYGRESQQDFTTSMLKLNPVPVSIQYEWDPCDVLKARELVALEQQGFYQKSAEEDTQSILLGLTGQKGRVVVSFGEPLKAEELSAADVMAKAIDQQICAMQEVMPVQQAALVLLTQQGEGDTKLMQQLHMRVVNEPEAVVKRLLTTYAAPLLS